MDHLSLSQKTRLLLSLPVIVASLGYFVDIYDLLLFGIVRISSMKDLGLDPDTSGTLILNLQMTGMLLGGMLWGVLGDRKGRLSVLFGSILVYSLANIACGFLPQIPIGDKLHLYAALRFLAGVGLAGELGAGITLVSESLPKELRALGTSIVAGFGVLGAVVAQLTVEAAGSWTVAYLIGGGLGLALLVLRIGVSESGMFLHIEKQEGVAKGNFLCFFTSRKRLVKYLRCILIGVPIWYCIAVFAMMCNQIGGALGIGHLEPGKAIMWAYAGTSAGDFLSGFFSHILNSRKKAILAMMLFTTAVIAVMLSGAIKTETGYYICCVLLGFGAGFWAMLVTVAAEQFGTNIRATATTTVPNMVRGLVPVILIGFDALKPRGVLLSAGTVGAVVFILGIYSAWRISETHGRDLDFTE